MDEEQFGLYSSELDRVILVHAEADLLKELVWILSSKQILSIVKLPGKLDNLNCINHSLVFTENLNQLRILATQQINIYTPANIVDQGCPPKVIASWEEFGFELDKYLIFVHFCLYSLVRLRTLAKLDAAAPSTYVKSIGRFYDLMPAVDKSESRENKVKNILYLSDDLDAAITQVTDLLQ